MNIELRFLQKAVEDKNYVSFSYQGKNYEKEKALSLETKDSEYILKTSTGSFEFTNMSKIRILKQKF